MKEKFCPKANCYYHGYESKCPECGTKTKPVKEPSSLKIINLGFKAKDTPKKIRGTMKNHWTDGTKEGKNRRVWKAFGTGYGIEDIYQQLRSTKHESIDFKTNPQHYFTEPLSAIHNKPAKHVIYKRERIEDDEEKEWYQYNHSEQLRYKCKSYFKTGYDDVLQTTKEYYIMEKEYPTRNTIIYLEIAKKIKENDKFYYGGFDSHDEDPWSGTETD